MDDDKFEMNDSEEKHAANVVAAAGLADRINAPDIVPFVLQLDEGKSN